MLFGKKDNTKLRNPSLMVGQDGYTFRRSRTLTGSVSPQVSVTAQARSQLKTDRLKVQELTTRRKQLFRAFITVSLACMVLFFVISSELRTIHVGFLSDLTNKSGFNQDVYKNSIKQYLSKHPLELFSFSLNESNLSRYVSEQHPEVLKLRADTSELGSNTIFKLQLRKPILIWDTPKGRLYVDSKGVSFEKSYLPDTNLVKVVDKSGITPEASGSTIASTRFVRFLGQLVEAVNGGNKGRVVSVIIPASTREIDLRLEGRDYDIKTHIDRDPGEQAEDIINALSHIDEKGIKPQYMDLRVASKAFYR